MAKLEIDLWPEEQALLERQARRAGLPVRDWVRRRLLETPSETPIRETPSETAPVTFTTDDGEVYEIPDLPADLGRATALASEAALSRLWNSPEEDAAWNGI